MKNKKYWLYATVIAMSLSAGTYRYSLNVHANSNRQVQQAAGVNLTSAISNSPVTPPSESGQIEGVSYRIDNGTLTLSGGTLKSGHDYPWPIYTITNVRITGPLKLEGQSAAHFFANMSNVRSIPMNNIDTSKAINMDSMFAGDSDLTNLDLSNFDTSKVTNMDSIFGGDGYLTNLDLSNFDTSNVTNMADMFWETGVTKLNLSNFDTSKVTNMNGMFASNDSLTDLNLSSFDTSKVTNMAGMFASDNLTNLNLSNFDTANVTDMSDMFALDINLTKLDVSNFDTSKVTNMSEMFSGDASLTDLNLSNFDTSNVTDMYYMISLDESLTNLDLSSFNTANVTNMSYMFAMDKGLSHLNVSNFNTSNVDNMSYMFYEDNNLTNLDASKFDTSNVYEMSWMFCGDNDLTNLDVSNFNTSNVYDMRSMFADDHNLTKLDLSSFDTSDVSSMSYIFSGDNKLCILKLGPESFDEGFDKTELSDHSSVSAIPNSNPVRYATGPGWVAVDAHNGGTVDNPQGKTVYDGYLSNRPAETETYVWQQKSMPAIKKTVTVEYIDAATGKPIPRVKVKTVSDYQGKEYDVSKSDFRPDISGYIWDGKIPTNAKGIYGNKDIVVQYVYKKRSTPSIPTTPTTPVTPSTPTTSSSSSSSSSTSSASLSTPTSSSSSSSSSNISLPNYAAAKGTVLYSINKIGLYRSTKFSAAKRSTWYTKKPRVYRPMFVVTGYKRAANGALRYRVRDVNHTSKTNGKSGYITASQKYVRPVYYATKHSTVTVINPRGVNAYRKANLTNKARSYRQGAVLHVKRIVTHNLTTRYVLTNGDYITANRKLVNMGRHKQVNSVKTKRALIRYSNANFTKKNHTIAKNRTLKVYGYDYSQKNSVTKHGALRYRVAGGYITANTKYVCAYK